MVLSDISEPVPDLFVARGNETDYLERHPAASDILLVVEVSDSSLQSDRKKKAAIYARYGIPEYWIVNLTKRQIEVYREPANGVYTVDFTSAAGSKFSPLFDVREIAVDDVLI